MPNFKIIDVPANENPVITINNLNSVAEDELHLIIHEKSAFFSHPAYCELLKREADFLGKNLKVFLPPNCPSEMFEKAGIVVEKIGLENQESLSSRNNYEHKKIVDISQPQFTPSFIENTETPEKLEKPDEIEIDKKQIDELDEFLEKSKQMQTKPYFQMPPKTPFYLNKFYLFGAVILILLIIGAFLYLPQAKITLISARSDVKAEVSFRVDKNATTYDIDNKIVPGGKVAPINISETMEFPISSSKNVKEKAKGKILMFNNSDQNQSLVPSRLEGPNGKIYWTDKNITIPAKSQVEVGITAANAGAEYNIQCSKENPCRFNILVWKDSPKGKQIYGQAENSISGGLIGEGKILTETDLKNATQKLEEIWKQKGIEEFKKMNLISGGKILDEKAFSFNIKEVKSDIQPGTTAEKFNLFMRGEVSTVVVMEADLKEFINKIIEKNISSDRIVYPDKTVINIKEARTNPNEGIMDVKAEVTAEIGYKFDPFTIKKEIAGMSPKELEKYLLNLKEAGKATGRAYLWPWLIARKVPTQLDRIIVEIK
jgi:ribosomal protein L29